MPITKTIKRKYENLIINPQDLIKLSLICYEPWKRDLEKAQRKWRNEKLPEIEEKIDQHNKDVKAKKSVYSFNTYLPISENDKKAIIEKERDFYIFISQKVHTFFSKFKVVLPNEELEHNKPEFLETIELEKIKNLEFSVETDGGKRIRLNINNDSIMNRELKYEIEGTDERWIANIQNTLEKTISDISKPHEITPFTFWIALVSSALLSTTLYKVLVKFGLFTFLDPFVNTEILNIIVTVFLGSYLILKTYAILNKIFPSFAIRSDYNPLNSTLVKVGIFIFMSIISPILYEFILFVFNR